MTDTSKITAALWKKFPDAGAIFLGTIDEYDGATDEEGTITP